MGLAPCCDVDPSPGERRREGLSTHHVLREAPEAELSPGVDRGSFVADPQGEGDFAGCTCGVGVRRRK